MEKTYIIAEAGVNHNGSIVTAKQLIDVAVEAGADAVKFQTFKADKIVSRMSPKAEYQNKTTDGSESQYEMLKRLELDEDAHETLFEYCSNKGIVFLSTAFDLDSLDLLVSKFNLQWLKIPSGDITNGPLLLKAATTNKPIILSTGMSTMNEIEAALGVLAFGYTCQGKEPSLAAFKEAYRSKKGKQALVEKVVLLHCTTEYPVPFSEVNLLAMDSLRKKFGLRVGYSDHTTGISIPIAAVACGAVIIEKHFTLNKSLPGPDHKASLEPDELKTMIESIRQVEAAWGNAIKVPTASELNNKPVIRKSITTARKISKGEKFTINNLTVKRPGTGISPMCYWEYLGKAATRDYEQDERVNS